MGKRKTTTGTERGPTPAIRRGRSDDAEAFLSDPDGGPARVSDNLAEQLAENFVESATSGENAIDETRDARVTEEFGGPFIETEGDEEFGIDPDASNPPGAMAEALPTATGDLVQAPAEPQQPEDMDMTETPDESLRQELVNLERRFWQAIKDKDGPAAMRLTDDPCIVTGAQGVGRIDRQALGQMIDSASYTLDDFNLNDDIEMRLVSDDVAVLAYQVHEELTVDGKPIAFDAADSSIWVRRNDGWVCALHSEAISGDPYGRDRHPPGG